MRGRCRSSPHAGSPVERPQGFGAPAAWRTGAAAATGSHEQPWKCGAGCTDLPRREVLLAEVRGPCVPHDLDMQAWLQTVYMRRVAVRDSRDLSMEYLIRAVQSPENPVPLVMDKEPLLGIFPIASRDSRLPLMGNRCRSRRNLTNKGGESGGDPKSTQRLASSVPPSGLALPVVRSRRRARERRGPHRTEQGAGACHRRCALRSLQVEPAGSESRASARP